MNTIMYETSLESPWLDIQIASRVSNGYDFCLNLDYSEGLTKIWVNCFNSFLWLIRSSKDNLTFASAMISKLKWIRSLLDTLMRVNPCEYGACDNLQYNSLTFTTAIEAARAKHSFMEMHFFLCLVQTFGLNRIFQLFHQSCIIFSVDGSTFSR